MTSSARRRLLEAVGLTAGVGALSRVMGMPDAEAPHGRQEAAR
jgi:hypothetical protein